LSIIAVGSAAKCAVSGRFRIIAGLLGRRDSSPGSKPRQCSSNLAPLSIYLQVPTASRTT
jgi:hypothetical protein